MPAAPSILIVAENASTRFGGEAILPWHYFRILRRRGIDARLIVHARTRDELLALLPEEAARMYFLPDTAFNKLAWRLGRYLPAKIADITLGYLSRLSTQFAARQLARRLVAEHRIDVVHQPIPVSPREPSLLYELGAPVVIGPMNGNMSYPPGMVQHSQRRLEGIVVTVGRLASTLLHRLMPGKLAAGTLLVANTRTRDALPVGHKGEVMTLIENGVDLQVWSPMQRSPDASPRLRFLFLGRLVDWKAVDLLLKAFAQLRTPVPAHLEIVGDGALRAALEAKTGELGLTQRVEFAGWQPQHECARRLHNADVLVLPSLYECGGAVVLEAMACGVPVIATAWGGPIDYLDASCGILVQPDSRDALIAGFVAAMDRLAGDPDLRAAMGRAGRARVEREFDWEKKVDDMVRIYQRVSKGFVAR